MKNLAERNAPYWNVLEFCRHIGIEKRAGHPVQWVARVRRTDGGYRQKRLAEASIQETGGIDYAGALRLARDWFADPETCAVSSTSYAVGANRVLNYVKTVDGFTIGNAMKDYVEWKRISAARSHFAYFVEGGRRFHVIMGTRFTPSWAAISRSWVGWPTRTWSQS